MQIQVNVNIEVNDSRTRRARRLGLINEAMTLLHCLTSMADSKQHWLDPEPASIEDGFQGLNQMGNEVHIH